MPVTIAEADARYASDWTKWPVPTMPDLPVPPWHGVAGCFWKDEVTAYSVDTARTTALPNYSVPMRAHAGGKPWQGSTYGMPFQIIDSAAPTTKVWDQSQPIKWSWFKPTYPIVNVPLPSVVRREGDPAGSSDLHWIGYDPVRRVMWEGITLRKTPRIQTFGQTDWIASYNGGGPAFSRWDTSKQWNAPGQPKGVCAANIPKFSLIPRWEEIQRGRIDHALFGSLPNYSPERVAPARGGDGSWVGHPVRAGERLRLRRAVVERFAPGTAKRVLAQALYEFGYVQADRNGPDGTSLSGRGSFPLTMDRRWDVGDGVVGPLGDFEVQLSDFEVVHPSVGYSNTYSNAYA